MTSGPIKIPPQQIPGQPLPPTTPVQQGGPAKPNPNVILEKLPEQLSDVKKTIEIKGQVIRDNRDGTLQIRTEKGDVTVRADTKELNVRQGDQVEIEIPPGRPPQTATVTSDTQAAPQRTTQTPVNVEVRPERPPEVPPVPATLREGQTVRLQPVPPAEAETYVPLPVDTQIAAIIEKFTALAQISAQDAQNYILSQLPNIAPQTSVTTLINASTTSQPVSQFTFPTVTATPFTIELGKPPLLSPISGQPTQAAIPPAPGLTLPDLASFSLTVQPNAAPTAFGQITQAILEPFRAQVANLAQTVSPAIVTPKIPPSPVITPDALIKTLDKPMILQNSKAGEIPAIVVGQTPQGLPVIGMISPTTGEEMFFIMHISGGAVLPGTELTLIPQHPIIQGAAASAPIMATVQFAPMPSYFLTPEAWPLMDDIYQTLAQVMPRAATAMSNMTPSPANPAQLGAAAMFFIAAVRGGDLTQWLGSSSVDALKRVGKSGLLNRLGLEGNTLNKLSSEPVSGEWRALALPFLHENQMQKIALYYKNDSQHQQQDEKGKQMRFVFDLSLDAMGKVQLDGLFRAQRLDLIVRAKEPFSQSMQSEMRRLYAGALGKTSIVGELSFQNRPDQWVTITPQSGTMGVSV